MIRRKSKHCIDLLIHASILYFCSMRFVKYIAGYTIPLSVFISIWLGGGWSFLAIIYAFGVLPLLEWIIPADPSNIADAEEEVVKNDKVYDVLLYLNVPIQFGLLWYFCSTVSLGGPWWELLGLTLTMGLACGVTGINVAHELGHRKAGYEQIMAKMLLLTSLYMHFIIEHNKGHHKHVSTDEDPASARPGEGLYAFWLRTVRDSWKSAWRIESKRLLVAQKPVISLFNAMIRFSLWQIGLVVVIGLVFNWLTALLFVGAALVGILLLETINYVEHYGLRRALKPSGQYERVMPWHSWNSNHYIGRICLYELTRHSDHHYLASRKYQVLRHLDTAPQMPAGYPAMMLLALLPPLWFNVMDPRVALIQEQYSHHETQEQRQ